MILLQLLRNTKLQVSFDWQYITLLTKYLDHYDNVPRKALKRKRLLVIDWFTEII